MTGLIQQRNASRAFGEWYELQKRKSEFRGNKSIKLIINDKSPALATKQCYLLYPEDGKMQSQQLWAQFNLLYVFCVHVLWVPLCLWPPRFQQWQEILPLLFTVLPSSSTLCSLPGADWLEGKRENGFSKLLFQGRANPFYQIAALSSSLPLFQVPHSFSSVRQSGSDFIFLSPSNSPVPFTVVHYFVFFLLFSSFLFPLTFPNLNTSRCTPVCASAHYAWFSVPMGLTPGVN